MNVEEYSFKSTLLSKYAPSLVSNPRNEMTRFFTGVDDLLKEEYHMAMIHNDINLSRIMVYAQSIEDSKFRKITRNLKMGRSEEKNQPRFKKRVPTQDSSSAHNFKIKSCSNSHGVNLFVLLVGRRTLRNV